MDHTHCLTYHWPCAAILRPFDTVDVLCVDVGDIIGLRLAEYIANEVVVECSGIVDRVDAVVVVVGRKR